MVSQIDPSPHDAGTTYLAVNRYKLDDYKPYAWVTNDYGKTWRKITGGLPEDGFVRVVREDPGKQGSALRGHGDRACTSRSTAARAGSRCS